MKFSILLMCAAFWLISSGFNANAVVNDPVTGTAFEDESMSMVYVDDDDINEFWNELNRESNEESAGEEEYVEEEEGSTEEEESPSEPEPEDPDSGEESSGKSPPVPETDWIDWDSVEGTKVPFFFLLDFNPDDEDDWEPAVAKLKAMKFADQIINGIPFRISSTTRDVYLTENITQVQEQIHMTGRTDYVDVARFDYEVILPEGAQEKITSGREVRSVSQMSGNTVAAAFESSRKQALTEAVKKAFVKEKITLGTEVKDEYTGMITGYHVVNEGWYQEEGKFFIEMIVWVKFDI